MPVKNRRKVCAIQAVSMVIFLMMSSLHGESSPPSAASPSLSKVLYKYCSPKINPNADVLVTSLSKSAPLRGFNLSISGNGSEVLYGILECRGDLSQKECATCSSMVASQVQTQCRNSSRAWIQLEGCYLRYEKHPFFWRHHDFSELYNQCGEGGSPSPDFNEVLEEVVSRAPINDGFYAASSSNETYALAHCNAYLPTYDCGVCLRVALYFLEFDCVNLDYMLYVEEGGSQILMDSCFLRIDKYRFFDLVEKGSWWNPEFPSAPPHKINKLVVAVTCGVVGGAVLALCLAGIYVKIKARRKLAQIHCIAVEGEVPQLSNEPTNIALANLQMSN